MTIVVGLVCDKVLDTGDELTIEAEDESPPSVSEDEVPLIVADEEVGIVIDTYWKAYIYPVTDGRSVGLG